MRDESYSHVSQNQTTFYYELFVVTLECVGGIPNCDGDGDGDGDQNY